MPFLRRSSSCVSAVTSSLVVMGFSRTTGGGGAVSGWLVGLPLTSGPVIFFLALSSGTVFAASAIAGTISGGFSLAAFCLAYAWLAIRFDWRVALTGSLLAYFGIVVLMQNIIIPFVPLISAVTLTIMASQEKIEGWPAKHK